MLDRLAKQLLDPALGRGAVWLARASITANQLSLVGLLLNGPLVFFLWRGQFAWAMVFILLNRLTDGVDGFLARLAHKKKSAQNPAQKTLGGFIDISNDYVFYGLVPLGFALFDPGRNALPTALVLFGFLMTAVSFLASAIVHHQWQSKKNTFQASKGFFYSFGIMEGTETIGFFLAACLFPKAYPVMAMAVAVICALTSAARFVGLVTTAR